MNPTINDWVCFKESLSERTYLLAVTITFKQFRKSVNQPLNRDIAVATICALINRLNREIFNHKAKRHGHTIGSVAVVGRNQSGGHIHAHLALGAPPTMTISQLASLINRIAKRFDWINRRCDFQPYRNRKWLRYMANHGTDSLVLECCNKARP